MASLTSSSLSKEMVRGLSESHQEPAWLQALRMNALEAYERLPLPHHDENWRNLRLADVPLEALQPRIGRKPLPPGRMPQWYKETAGRLFHYNSDVAHVQLDPALQERGVIFTSLTEAIRRWPERVQPYLGQLYGYGENKWAALHYALQHGGAFLYVPAGVEIDRPLHICTYADEAHAGVFNHLLVVAEANAQVSLIDQSSSSLHGGTAIHSGAVEIVAGKGARVSYTSLQQFDDGMYSFYPRRARLAQGAEVQWFVIEWGGRLVRSESTSYLEGEESSSTAALAFFADGEQTLDVSAGMIHSGSRSTSSIVAKGVAKDRAHTLWRGLGHIQHGAKNCKTSQTERSLMLSEQARGDAIPALLIDETDVLGAGHAAAVGRVDEEQLFYLMSRGLSRGQAQHMIVEGFLGTVLERIPSAAIRQEVYQWMQKKLGDLHD